MKFIGNTIMLGALLLWLIIADSIAYGLLGISFLRIFF